MSRTEVPKLKNELRSEKIETEIKDLQEKGFDTSDKLIENSMPSLKLFYQQKALGS